MGQSQSQEVDRFVDTYVNTQFLSEVVSRYATSTDAVTRNVQDFYLDLDARDIGGDITVAQNISSVINVRQMVERADNTEITNDIQEAVTTELRSAIESVTDGLSDIFSRPTNQAIRDQVLNNLDTYVRNVVTTETVDDLLTSSNNVQNQRIVINARDVTGDLTFDQNTQSEIIAENMSETIVNRLLENEEVRELGTLVTGEVTRESTLPSLGGLFSGWIPIAVAILVLIIGVILALVIPVGIGGKIGIGVVTLVIAAGIGIWAFMRR